MSGFYICKEELWVEAVDTAETLLKLRLANLKRSVEKLTPGERRAVAAMERKLSSFIAYGRAAEGCYRMNAG